MQRMQWIRSILNKPAHKKDLLLRYVAARHFSHVTRLYQLPNRKKSFECVLRNFSSFICLDVHINPLLKMQKYSASSSYKFCYCKSILRIDVSSVNKTTANWMDCRGLIPDRDRNRFLWNRDRTGPASPLSRPLIKCVSWPLSPLAKQLQLEPDQSPPTMAEIMNAWSFTFILHKDWFRH
jgi:hypothetical protein